MNCSAAEVPELSKVHSNRLGLCVTYPDILTVIAHLVLVQILLLIYCQNSFKVDKEILGVSKLDHEI